MSDYNTTSEINNQLDNSINRNNVYGHRTKKNITKKNEDIIGQFFFALSVAKANGTRTDHSPSNPRTRTIDIYQVQQLISNHCKKLHTHIEIINALYDLNEPELVQPSTIYFKSALDGTRIKAIRLLYSHSDKDQTDCNAKSFELQEQTAIDRDTIKSLRAIISEMAETLYEADPNARISMTSADLLELMQGRDDATDNPF